MSDKADEETQQENSPQEDPKEKRKQIEGIIK